MIINFYPYFIIFDPSRVELLTVCNNRRSNGILANIVVDSSLRKIIDVLPANSLKVTIELGNVISLTIDHGTRVIIRLTWNFYRVASS